VMSRDKLR